MKGGSQEAKGEITIRISTKGLQMFLGVEKETASDQGMVLKPY